MDDSDYNAQIEKIANMMLQDKISIDEQDLAKLEKYKNRIINDCNLDEETAMGLVYESLLYLKMKNSDGGDPLQKGDQFGAGFS